MERKPGYYWCEFVHGEKHAGYWDGKEWRFAIPPMLNIFHVINETRIPSPDEQPKCITPEMYKFISDKVDEFNTATSDYHDVDTIDVLHTYFNPNELLNDWDEGEFNDPFWDKATNQHSVIKFINDLIEQITTHP